MIPGQPSIGSNSEPSRPVAEDGSAHNSTALMPAGTEVMALYRQLVRAIASSSEDVGASFADEARKIHYNEAPERPIRGQASPDECEALRDEGIHVLHLPTLKDEDLN